MATLTIKSSKSSKSSKVLRLSVADQSTPWVHAPHNKISLGLGLVFDSSDEVLDYCKKQETFDTLPTTYKNRLTTRFLSGRLESQIFALFKDFRKYGEQVTPKIKEYLELLKTEKGEIHTKGGSTQVGLNLPNPSKRLVTSLFLKINPSDPSMLLVGSNRLDMTYLKLWILEELINRPE